MLAVNGGHVGQAVRQARAALEEHQGRPHAGELGQETGGLLWMRRFVVKRERQLPELFRDEVIPQTLAGETIYDNHIPVAE